MTSPSDSPPPGWYADPGQPGMLRWWDGGTWTNDLRPVEGAQPIGQNHAGGLRPISDWMTETFRLIVGNIGSLLTLVVILAMPASLISSYGLWAVAKDVVIQFENDLGQPTVEVTGFGSGPLFGLSIILSIFLTILFNTAAARLLIANRFSPLMGWAQSLTSAGRRFAVVLGWSLVASLIVGAVMTLFIVFVAIAAVLGAIGAILAVVGFVGLVFFFGRYAMMFTNPMIGTSGARSISEVHRITTSRTVGMVGRALLLAIVAGTAYFAGSIFAGPLSGLGGAQGVQPGATTFRVRDIVGENVGLFMLLQLGTSIVAALATLIWHAGMSLLFEDLGGQLDPEIRATEPVA